LRGRSPKQSLAFIEGIASLPLAMTVIIDKNHEQLTILLMKQDNDYIVIYRLLCLATVVLIPIFRFIYELINPLLYNPIEYVMLVVSSGLALLILSYVSNYFKKHMKYFMYALYSIIFIWDIHLLFMNQFTANGVLGFLIIVYAVSVGFENRKHLGLFLFMLFLAASSTCLLTDNVEINEIMFISTLGAINLLAYIINSSKIKAEAEIKKVNSLLAQKNKDITDSINYAQRIQEAILPNIKQIQQLIPESFLFYKPKDVVSGDFPWFLKKGDDIFIAAVDCTGHGVPGAFMSLIAFFLLNRIVNRFNITQPAAVLDRLHIGVQHTLKQHVKDAQARDGMDIAFCAVDVKKRKVEYAGAYRPLFIIRKGELIEIKADKFPIGGESQNNEKFTNHQIDVQKDDIIYLFSDGYVDQFGGERNKKFMTKRFKELLIKINSLDLLQQKERLEKEMKDWMGNNEQVDDVLVIGFKV